MGFGSVAVPEGCQVKEVQEVLLAADYYQVMGFASTVECTTDALKAARRRLQLAVHPDKVGHDPGANQAAGRVNKAYETLSNTEERKTYDKVLAFHMQRGRGGRSGKASGRRIHNIM
eukprot:gene7572-7775_t